MSTSLKNAKKRELSQFDTIRMYIYTSEELC